MALSESIFTGLSTELLIFISVILWFLYRSIEKSFRYNLPPSASILNHLPILGYMPFVNAQTIHKDVIPMGPIVRFKFGPDDVVM